MPVQRGGQIVEDGQIIAPVPSAPIPAPSPPAPSPPAPSPQPPPQPSKPAPPPPPPKPAEEIGGLTVAKAVAVAQSYVATPKPTQPAVEQPEEIGGVSAQQAEQIAADYGVTPDGQTTVIGGTGGGGNTDATGDTFTGSLGPWSDEDDDGSTQDVFLDDSDVTDLDGLQFLSYDALSSNSFVNYVRAGCEKRQLDPLAVFANAYHEGIGGGIGDYGTSYGPWQLHSGGALPRKYWGRTNDPAVNAWAWSSPGIDYALNVMAGTRAKGETGDAAVHDLVFYFEQPANKQQQYIVRLDTYYALKQAGDSAWSLLAQAARGAKTVLPTPDVPEAQPVSPVGPSASWRTLMSVLHVNLRNAGTKATNIGNGLTKVVK